MISANDSGHRQTDPLQQSSAERLVRALKEELAQTRDGRLQLMILRARDRVYDPYRGKLQHPRRTLIMECANLGHTALAQRVADNEFDPTAAETSAFIQSTEGQAIMTDLLHVTTKSLTPYNSVRAAALIEEAARLARMRRAVSQHWHE